jgi:hypothetical protein
VSLLRKGAIVWRGGLPTFKPKGLAPQKVAESYSDWATGDTHQRKVFFDGSNFFVWFWNGIDLNNERWEKLATSSDGKSWTVNNRLQFSVGPGGIGHAGNFDVLLNPADKTSCFEGFIGSADDGERTNRGSISNSTITWTTIWGCSLVATTYMNGGHICLTPKQRFFAICHGKHPTTGLRLDLSLPIEGLCRTHTNIPDHSSITGGVQILPYNTSSPWDALVLLKDKDDLLWYSLLRDSNYTIDTPFTSLEVTLASGFSSFCACSEAQLQGDPERIHLVYIKSTGKLCYNKFENDEWDVEKVLVASGASYPVIAVGSGGKLYIFYVKDGKIWVIHRRGVWYRPVELFTANHTYNNPAYLSCNQNVQNGKICLVWTEGVGTPYEVWFSYLED